MSDKQTASELATTAAVEVLSPSDEIAKIADLFSGLQEYELPKADPNQVTRDVMLQILAAKDEDELWGELPTWSTKDNVGRVYKILGGSIYPSRFTRDDGTKGAFLACRAVDVESGELGILNTSAARVAAKILWHARHEKLPIELRIVKRGESSNGYAIIDCERL